MRQLTELSGHSRATIQRILHYWLEHPPEVSAQHRDSRYLIFDGTFLHRRRGMYAAMEGIQHRLIYAGYGVNEGPRDLAIFCRWLKQQGLTPKSITIDGNPHIFRIAQALWPQVIIQRCLIHIQRQGLSWCRLHPKRTDARHLRQILLMVLNVRSHRQRQQFERSFDQWNEHYGRKLVQTSNRGWVTIDLQRARSMILRALPYMFSFLEDSNIPRSTNALEGYFSRLKHRYRQHRGLSMRHRTNYFQWYFYLCSR